ncbi:hypothetical protein B0T10DRAFT_135315 [Thelonectria olida]|uniref:BZIP domain-containing protein n=1 Tax=Thelonectria olida TaxID=1576542 RepID=A0A9P8W0W0_9HYPO|nr:hypothetical protein B0T10DRAFT_135315 [Thelonectria olida]
MPDHETVNPAGIESAAPKNPPKRVLTAARKEQNRVAQKAYRKRQRELREKHRANVLRSKGNPPTLTLLRPREAGGSSQAEQRALQPPITGSELFQFQQSQNDAFLHFPSIPMSTQDQNISPSTALAQLPSRSESEPRTASSPFKNLELTLSCTGGLSAESSGGTASGSGGRNANGSSQTDQSLLPTIGDADIYASAPHAIRNTLQLAPNRVFAAGLENAMVLGFDLEKLLECNGDYVSPFYQSNANPHSDPLALISASTSLVSSSNGGANIPIHLRPTMAQVLVPHPAGLDLIPIPFFRERAIMLSVAMPGTFSMWELQKDIFSRDGLMFWQPTRLELGSKSGCPMFQPWDMRSWEAAPWFLEKWCMIFGGAEHSFWKQSIWWNSLRVEEDCSPRQIAATSLGD